MKRTFVARIAALIAVIISFCLCVPLPVVATQQPSFFPIPPGTATTKPTPYFIIYRAVYYDYCGKLRRATPTLAGQFFTEIADRPGNIDYMAEIINDKILVLAEIIVDAPVVLENRVHNIPHLNETDLWYSRIYEVYEQEAFKLMEFYEQEALKYLGYN